MTLGVGQSEFLLWEELLYDSLCLVKLSCSLWCWPGRLIPMMGVRISSFWFCCIFKFQSFRVD